MAFECDSLIEDPSWTFKPGFSSMTCDNDQFVTRTTEGGLAKKFKNLKSHASAYIKFKLAVFGNWNSQIIGILADSKIVYQESFNSANFDLNNNICSGSSTGSIEVVGVEFEHSLESITLQFVSSLSSSNVDASWGICGIEVYLNSCPIGQYLNGQFCVEACPPGTTTAAETRTCQTTGVQETSEVSDDEEETDQPSQLTNEALQLQIASSQSQQDNEEAHEQSNTEVEDIILISSNPRANHTSTTPNDLSNKEDDETNEEIHEQNIQSNQDEPQLNQTNQNISKELTIEQNEEGGSQTVENTTSNKTEEQLSSQTEDEESSYQKTNETEIKQKEEGQNQLNQSLLPNQVVGQDVILLLANSSDVSNQTQDIIQSTINNITNGLASAGSLLQSISQVGVIGDNGTSMNVSISQIPEIAAVLSQTQQLINNSIATISQTLQTLNLSLTTILAQ